MDARSQECVGIGFPSACPHSKQSIEGITYQPGGNMRSRCHSHSSLLSARKPATRRGGGDAATMVRVNGAQCLLLVLGLREAETSAVRYYAGGCSPGAGACCGGSLGPARANHRACRSDGGRRHRIHGVRWGHSISTYCKIDRVVPSVVSRNAAPENDREDTRGKLHCMRVRRSIAMARSVCAACAMGIMQVRAVVMDHSMVRCVPRGRGWTTDTRASPLACLPADYR